MDCCDRELMRYVATTGGITAEMVQDLLLESMEYRFGQSERVRHPHKGLKMKSPWEYPGRTGIKRMRWCPV